MQFIKAALIMVGALVVNASAMAEVYLGGTVGRSNHPYEDVGDDGSSRLFAGYQFTDRDLALEVGTIDMGAPRIENFGTMSIDGQQMSLLWSSAAQSEGQFTFTGRIGFYSLESTLSVSGVGSVSEESTGIMWGLGGRHKITQKLAIVGEILGYGKVSYLVDEDHATVFDIGLQYNF